MLVTWNLVRWPLAALLFAAATAAVFRWSPRRRQPRWTWLIGGAVPAVGALRARDRRPERPLQVELDVRVDLRAARRYRRPDALDLRDLARAARWAAPSSRRRRPSERAPPSRVGTRTRPPAEPSAVTHRPGRRPVMSAPPAAGIDARRGAPGARGDHRRPGDRGQSHRDPAQRRPDLPRDARVDRRRPTHDRLPDVRVLERGRGCAVRGGARRASPRRRARAAAARRLGRAADRPGPGRDDGGGGRPRPMVPADPPGAAVQGEPPDPPQGRHRRRGGRVHRRRRHRRRVAGRRAQRAGVARHALPRPRTRPWTACGRPSWTTGPRATTSCSTRRSTRSPTSRRSGPRSSSACEERRRRAGATSRRSTSRCSTSPGRACG